MEIRNREHFYLVLRILGKENSRAFEITAVADEFGRAIQLSQLGDFVLGALESLNDQAEDNDDIEIFLTTVDEDAHRRVQSLQENMAAIERLIQSDPRVDTA